MRLFPSYPGQYLYSIALMIDNFLSKYYDSSVPGTKSVQCVRNTLDILLYKTLSEKVIWPYRTIISNPITSAIVTLVLYILFCIVYVPLWLASYVVTVYGSMLILFAMLHYLTIFIARNLAFPGGNASFQREVSSDYIRRLSHQLENLSSYTANFTATIMLVVNNQIGRGDLSQIHSKLQDIITAAENLPPLMLSLRKAADIAFAGKCEPKEVEDINQFLRVLETFQKALAEFTPEVTQLLVPQERKISTKRQHFIVLAGRCLQASDNLRALSTSLRPTRPDEDLYMQVKRMLIEGGPHGLEKLAFPAMRDTLVHKYKGTILPLTGPDGNKINAMLFPSKYTSSSAQLSSTSVVSLDGLESHAESTAYRPSSVGTVLFCGPNAAVYEVLSLANLEACWFGWYLSLGFDICFFNYRGYPGSEGQASPAKVKADAMVVYNYLKSDLKVEKILVHGESIGGMAACYLAKHASIDLLIADRTFASLDAVAMRMMNKTIGYCLKYLGFWFTDSVADYLDAKTMKLIVQDVDDLIIHNTSSLKAGIAQRLLLQDSAYTPRSLAQSYIIADALGEPVPSRAKEEEMIRSLEMKSSSQLEDSLQHLYACLAHLSRCLTHEATSSFHQQQQQQPFLESESQASIPWELLSTNQASATTRRRSPSISDQAAGNNETVDLGTPRSRDIEENLSSDYEYHNNSSDAEAEDEDDEDQALNSSTTAAKAASGLGLPFSIVNEPNFNSQVDRLKYYSKISITKESSLSDYQQAWLAISLLAGVDGQLLGQAFARGYDSFRSWICCYTMWSSRAIDDTIVSSLGKNCQLKQCLRSLQHVIESLQKKRLFTHISSSSSAIAAVTTTVSPIHASVDQQRSFQQSSAESHRHSKKRTRSPASPPDMLTVVDSISFVSLALQAIKKRMTMLAHHDRVQAMRMVHPYPGLSPTSSSIPLGFHPHDSSSTSSSDAASVVEVDEVGGDSSDGSGSGDSSSSIVKIASSKLLKSSAYHLTSSASLEESQSDSPSSLIAAAAADLGIGCLLPTHAGHNGWPHPQELKSLEQYIRCAGFDIRSSS
jgi:hypothetical protein